MKEAKSGNLHYIFLQVYVNEPHYLDAKALEECRRQILLAFPVNSRFV
jgi:hypothetical protein